MSAPSQTRSLALPAGLLIACAVGCAILAMGLRQSFGLFLAPMTAENGWTASGFALAIALQVLLNGVSQPLTGQLADRFGGRKVIIGGALLYATGILGMAFSAGLPLFTFFAGVVMGVAVSAAGMPTIIASLTRMLPEEKRGRAVGLGTAGSSAGQFLIVPLAGLGIAGFGWQWALVAMALAALLMIPLAMPLNDRPATPAANAAAADNETARAALSRAFRDPSFWCLFFGFFVCGVHVSFLTVHLPGFVHSCGLPLYVGAGAISLIGLFNIAGSLISGELTQKWKRRELLVGIYAARGVLMTAFLLMEKTTTSVMIFAALMGILWLSTVPPTVALCARNWGTRWLATIFGLVFLGHQIGGFTGAFLGGLVFDRTGSYDLMWVFGILAAAFAAIVHLPVRDGPRPALAAA
ncbi:MFS transporter [Roseomonas sp. PWR1]|uniref:MFS transporter n=1 Tax=Roseomonas nitratireducens TaxID=2820810 RepID=A0ABS4AXS9_9PROT|nr:MFS transporter [Neoroseomonas nitratireducens]MBP0465536.1 MFS transporter [Neoroseomonas nitratireducens]